MLVLGLSIVSIGFTPDPSSADAPPQAPDELDRWVPSIGFYGGVQEQNAEATADTSLLNPSAPRCTPQRVNCEIDDEIQPSSDGEDALRAFRGGLSVELMSRRLVEGFGHPRVFVHVDPILSEGFERSITGVGNPGPMVEGELAVDAQRSDAQAFSGQGTRVLAKSSPFVLNVGAGIAFTVDFSDQRVRIKPSIEYVREILSVTGKANRVVQVAQIPKPNTPSDFRFIELRSSDSQTYHGLGPGLDVEVDGSRIGPFTLSPFAGAHAYYYFGNLDVDLSATNEFDESANWRFQRDRWQWTARFGVRLRWNPI
ncbi:MAG: hypothetical protein R3F35_06880 [Myxococcota bacterium]